MTANQVDLESIFYDLVSWGLFPATLQGLKKFMLQPTWLTMSVWNKTQKNKANQLQQQSIATAKLTNCVVSAFGSGKGVKFDDFTLFRFESLGDDIIPLESILIYDQCLDKNLLPSHVVTAFSNNNIVGSAIKSKGKLREIKKCK